MSESYYNTNRESGNELAESTGKAQKQEDIIYNYFKNNPDAELTPFEVQAAINLVGTPITSIRRAITNLTHDGKLIKTNNQKRGEYGKKNFCWKFKPEIPLKLDGSQINIFQDENTP